MNCPANCGGGNRAGYLPDGIRNSILEQDPKMEEILTSNTHRCNYCTLVFEPSTPPKRLGMYGDPMSGGNGFDWESI